MMREWTARPDGRRDEKEEGETQKLKNPKTCRSREPTVATLSFPGNVFILLRKEERKRKRERERGRERTDQITCAEMTAGPWNVCGANGAGKKGVEAARS